MRPLNLTKKSMLLKVIMVMLLANRIAFALEIHKCTDANGKTIFSDMPCEQEPSTVTQANKRIADKPIIKVSPVTTANKPQIPIPVANETYNTETNEITAKEREIAIIADKQLRILAEQPKSNIAMDKFISKAKDKMLAADLQAVQHLYLSSTNFIPWLREHQIARLAAWQKAAERGHAGAQWLLGLCYGYRICKTENNDEADWCSKAAIQGNVWGKTSLGIILSNKLHGKPVNQELFNQVMTLFIEAAKQGFAPAQYWLGLKYGQDYGINKDCEQTYNWWYKAAKQGNARAQDSIGSLYNGFPPMHFNKNDEYVMSNFGMKCTLPRDYSQAVIWYSKAAEQGYVRGQYNLGMMYKLGRGVTQDYKQAMNWLLKAAEQKDSLHREDVWAKRQISSMYEKGLGVTQDHNQAAMWLQKIDAK